MMNEIRQNQTWEVCPKAAKVTRRARVLNVLGNEVELLFLDHTIFPISLALSARSSDCVIQSDDVQACIRRDAQIIVTAAVVRQMRLHVRY